MRTDPDGSTLYLGDQEIKVANDAARTVTTNRYYRFGGETAWVRADWAAVRKVIGDRNGTTQVSIDPVNGWAVSRRYMDPYGNALAPVAGTAGVMPGTRDFVNQPRNKVTSFVDMGARQYDSVTGQFLSVDPIVQGTDVKQSQGYTYANNNPVTFSDPTGLTTNYVGDGGGGGGCGSSCEHPLATVARKPNPKWEGVEQYYQSCGCLEEAFPDYTWRDLARDATAATADQVGAVANVIASPGCVVARAEQGFCASDLTDYVSEDLLHVDRSSDGYEVSYVGLSLVSFFVGGGAAATSKGGGGFLARLLGRTKSAPPGSVTANAVTRSLDDVASLRGASPGEIENLIPSNWVKSATNANKGGLGVRYSNPERLGEQIRVMPGKATDPNPVKQGPYLRISRNGTVTDPIPLEGNPTSP